MRTTDRSAKSLNDRPIAVLRRGRRPTDAIHRVNPTSRPRIAYVAIDSATLTASDRLDFRRERRN